MFSQVFFHDRTEAGEKLGEKILLDLTEFYPVLTLEQPIIVYALPRGGLPIALPIARLLKCPLDIVIAKKITRNDNPELALGAVTSQGDVLWGKYQPRQVFQQNSLRQEAQIKAKNQLLNFLPFRPPVHLDHPLILLVDDGIATGMTIRVAVQALRQENPLAIWICTPVAPLEIIDTLKESCDHLIVLETPEPFYSVSRFYEKFEQVENDEAISCLQQQFEWL